MAYNRITWAPDVLRKAGIVVVEHDGWRTRGLSTARRFEPRYIVWHHDASPPGDSPSVPDYMIRNMQSAGAQIWVDRKGRWHFIASGRMPHAGETINGVVNENSIGIETDHTTGEAWPPALLNSLRVGTAALLDAMQRPTEALHFHKTIAPARKVDPDGLTLSTERVRVARIRRATAAPKEPQMNHVQKGREHIKRARAHLARALAELRAAVREYRAADPKREVVARQAVALRVTYGLLADADAALSRVLKNGPES